MTPSDGSGQPRRFFLILQSGKDHRGRIGEGAVGIKGVPGSHKGGTGETLSCFIADRAAQAAYPGPLSFRNLALSDRDFAVGRQADDKNQFNKRVDTAMFERQRNV